jgi:hypothetical protein
MCTYIHWSTVWAFTCLEPVIRWYDRTCHPSSKFTKASINIMAFFSWQLTGFCFMFQHLCILGRLIFPGLNIICSIDARFNISILHVFQKITALHIHGTRPERKNKSILYEIVWGIATEQPRHGIFGRFDILIYM